jgi:hypothetical protein
MAITIVRDQKALTLHDVRVGPRTFAADAGIADGMPQRFRTRLVSG